MSGLSCSNPHSCHPFLLTFGLITVFLMAIYVIRDTIFDNARPKKGPILSTFNAAMRKPPPPRQGPVSGSGDARFTDEGLDGFKALRYEDTRSGNCKRPEHGNGERRSTASIVSSLTTQKPRQHAVHEEADTTSQSADIADDSLKHEDRWYGNFQHLKNSDAEASSESPTFNSEKPRQSDLEFRPATFVDEGSDGFQAVDLNPYTWRGHIRDIEKGNSKKHKT